MGLQPGTKITDITLDRVFIGSCTNGRIEDLRAVAKVVEGKRVHRSVNAMVVPGSGLVKMQAEAEGIDKIFMAAGFDWREPGCSMCLAMNADRLAPGERCASTSNRNFEGRQGFKGRTHLVSPAMAAAAAIAGRFVDVRTLGLDGPDEAACPRSASKRIKALSTVSGGPWPPRSPSPIVHAPVPALLLVPTKIPAAPPAVVPAPVAPPGMSSLSIWRTPRQHRAEARFAMR